MNNKINQNITIKENVIYAFFSQFISLIISILTSFTMPKVLGIEDYAYYQLFVFYITYVGFTLLGLNDGIYLRFGGKKWEELDKELIKIQWIYSIIMQIVFTLIFMMIIFLLSPKIEIQRCIIYITTAIYMFINNTYGYFGYLFQTVNNTKLYSKSIIIERCFFIICVLFCLLINFKMFYIYIIITIIAKFVAMIYCMKCSKDVLFCKVNRWHEAFEEMKLNISVGIKLLLANIASMLVLGIGRFLIDIKWGISAFGIFSFSLSLANFFLMFINQLSMVLFPALKRITLENQKNIFNIMNKILFIILPIIYLGYLPVSLFINMWLPQYTDSISYLSIILPICIFDGRMNLLYLTYFKILRMEKQLLFVNSITVLFSFLLSFSGAFVMKNIILVMIGIVISIALRCTISGYLLSKIISCDIMKTTIIEIAISIIFIISNQLLNTFISFFILFIIYLILVFNNREFIKDCMNGKLKSIV